MKTLKSKIIAGVTAIVIAFGVFFAVNAQDKVTSTESKPSSAVTTQTYHYLLDDPNGENDPMNWAEGPSESDCDGTEVLCSITAPIGANGRPDFSGITNVRTSPLVTDKEFKD